jgi:ribosomal-protein-alanine N-acetyltransferase
MRLFGNAGSGFSLSQNIVFPWGFETIQRVRFLLRCYVPADLETLYEIDQLCYPPEIAYSRRELRNYLRFPGADCLIAEAAAENVAEPSHKIIGFCITARLRAEGYIITMDVLSAHRRQGVATALLAEAERRLAQNGVLEVGLETATDNDSAIAFWQKHGYRETGIRKNYYPGGLDAFSMVKTLRSA